MGTVPQEIKKWWCYERYPKSCQASWWFLAKFLHKKKKLSDPEERSRRKNRKQSARRLRVLAGHDTEQEFESIHKREKALRICVRVYQWIRNREKFPRLQLGKWWEAVSLAASYASIATSKAEEANRDSRMMPVTLHCGKRSVNTVLFLEEGSSFTLVGRALVSQLRVQSVKQSLRVTWTAGVFRI